MLVPNKMWNNFTNWTLILSDTFSSLFPDIRFCHFLRIISIVNNYLFSLNTNRFCMFSQNKTQFSFFMHFSLRQRGNIFSWEKYFVRENISSRKMIKKNVNKSNCHNPKRYQLIDKRQKLENCIFISPWIVLTYLTTDSHQFTLFDNGFFRKLAKSVYLPCPIYVPNCDQAKR